MEIGIQCTKEHWSGFSNIRNKRKIVTTYKEHFTMIK